MFFSRLEAQRRVKEALYRFGIAETAITPSGPIGTPLVTMPVGRLTIDLLDPLVWISNDWLLRLLKKRSENSD